MTRDDRPGSPRQHDLAELFRAHANGLAGVVRGILGTQAETQELLQEAFLRAWQSLRGGSVPDNPVAWLFVITMNLAKDLRRQQSRQGKSQALEEVNPMELRSADPAPDAGLTQAETLAAARAADQRPAASCTGAVPERRTIPRRSVPEPDQQRDVRRGDLRYPSGSSRHARER